MKFLQTTRGKIISGIAVLVVIVIILVIVLGSSSPPKGHVTTTTASIPTRTHTTAQQAVIASLSVARAALYHTKTATTTVTASDISWAALPDKGTLIVVKNLGDIPGAANTVAFQWDFGPTAVSLVCVTIPTNRSGTPATVTCPTGVKQVKVPVTKSHSTTTLKHHTKKK
jgi:hypothetical protein